MAAAMLRPEPRLTFRDVTAASGVVFQHETGGFVRPDGEDSRYPPETIGSGVALFDLEGDGDLDVLAVNSCSFSRARIGATFPSSGLFRNEGGFRFSDVTEAWGLAVPLCAMGAWPADYDGDSRTDLLITTWGGPRLFRNLASGRFQDVTTESGLSRARRPVKPISSVPDWATAAAFFDADGDQDLDLFVAHYVRWSPEIDIFTTYDGRRKGYTSPKAYAGSSPALYLQTSVGRFEDATAKSGIFAPKGKALGAALWDVDGDGRLDVLVANDTEPTFLYRNAGRGRFIERALAAGVAYGEDGSARSGMGIDIADYWNDGTAGVAIGNFSGEAVSLFHLAAPGVFREVSRESGVAAPTIPSLTFGLVFADMDLDGWQDLVLANGHVEPNIGRVEEGAHHAQPLQLLGNLGGGRFADWSAEAGEAFQIRSVGRGLAIGDLDDDGDLDIVVAVNGGTLRLIRNESPRRHYLRVRLRGRSPNTGAIGAVVEVDYGALTQRRVVRTGSSYLSQSELTQTFGLGERQLPVAGRIVWPNGTTTEAIWSPDQTVDVDEGARPGRSRGFRSR